MNADKQLPATGVEYGCASRFTRRQLLKGLTAVLGLPVYQSVGLAGTLDVATSESIPFDRFVVFSRNVTGYRQLNLEMAKSLFDIFSAEPWGIDHLKRVHDKLTSGSHGHDILASLDKGEHWFLGHFLTTWITGIYYHSSGNQMVSYEHALMYEAFENIRPIPGLSEQEFGFWSKPPLDKGL